MITPFESGFLNGPVLHCENPVVGLPSFRVKWCPLCNDGGGGKERVQT